MSPLPRDFRKHPVARVILHASAGARGRPSEPELDALRLSPALRRRVADTCREVAEIFDSGAQGNAHAVARERAVELLNALPESQHSEDYLRPPADVLADYDPAELAAQVTRW